MRHLQRLGVRSRRANDMRGSLYRRARSHCACRARDDTEGSKVGVPTIPGGRHVVPITRESREAVCRGVRRKVRDILEVPDVGVVVEVEVPDDVAILDARVVGPAIQHCAVPKLADTIGAQPSCQSYARGPP